MRIVMVDDHEMMHIGVREILTTAPDIELVGKGYCGEDFERLVREYQPEIVLLDLNMPKQLGKRTTESPFNPAEAIRWCHAQHPAVRIVVFSQRLDLSVLNLGVAGYLLKEDTTAAHELPTLLRAVAAGQKKTSKAVLEALQANPLTERQLEILHEIVDHPNRTQAEHATALNMSESGLKKHLGEIYDRLRVTNLTAAVVAAQWAGYISFTFPNTP